MAKTKKIRVLVTGAGGFIGHHLVKYLKKKGYWVRGVDIRKPLFEKTSADEFLRLDLRLKRNCKTATSGVDEVYALAADMGGMGYLSFNHSKILTNNLLININTIREACKNGVKRYFYSSSACVYPIFKQEVTNVKPLKEEDVFPAQPQDAYGWEKLITEILVKHYSQDKGIKVRIARFHNIFGPEGAWEGERAKAPAALCRKIAIAKLKKKNSIEIWGDGKQTRSFCYIDDCITGIYKLMRSSFNSPLNIGQDRLVTINKLADIIIDIAGVKIKKIHIPGPEGVRGRNSDNTNLKKVLHWEPKISLELGLRKTYEWIEKEIIKKYGSKTKTLSKKL